MSNTKGKAYQQKVHRFESRLRPEFPKESRDHRDLSRQPLSFSLPVRRRIIRPPGVPAGERAPGNTWDSALCRKKRHQSIQARGSKDLRIERGLNRPKHQSFLQITIAAISTDWSSTVCCTRRGNGAALENQPAAASSSLPSIKRHGESDTQATV